MRSFRGKIDAMTTIGLLNLIFINSNNFFMNDIPEHRSSHLQYH